LHAEYLPNKAVAVPQRVRVSFDVYAN
jgi:hypothetical protein